MRVSTKYLLLVLWVGLLSPFCSIDDECDFGSATFTPELYDIEGIQLSDISQNGRKVDWSGEEVDSVLLLQRNVDVVLNLTYIIQYVWEELPSIKASGSWLLSEATACSLLLPDPESKSERHAGINVKTIKAYSADIDPGESLNGQVRIGDNRYGFFTSPIDSIVNDTSRVTGLNLALTVPAPAVTDTMQLNIEFKLDNGEHYEVLTPLLLFRS